MKTFAWSPIRALMKDSGATIVSRDAVDALIEHLEEYARKLTIKALEMTRFSKRKKLIKKDIIMAKNL